ncbi:hypothetical protein ACLD43_06215 [Clostridium botulinum]|uniref:hypothetical protein n=1 Tax=Clostridium botulinum TaxID=1491 RepID=UPI003A8086CC
MHKLDSIIVDRLNVNKNSPKYFEVIGINALIILDKTIFKNNADTIDYIKYVFNITFMDYVIRSRTLINARLSKKIFSSDEEQLIIICTKILDFFEENKKDNLQIKKKVTKQSNANKNMQKWIRGISGK